ncbi:MAG: carboxylesterase family protein [Solobacterium sp.]|nr:carboxylesterase family protein [Solobacterium sp.]
MKVFFWIILSIMILLTGAFLELNQNSIAGWIMWVIWIAAFIAFAKNRISSSFFIVLLLWISFAAVSALIIRLSWPQVKPVAAVPEKDPEYTDIYHTEKGDVRGVYNKDHTVEIFTGIPYAKPPVGDLRWRKPQDPEIWTGVKDCDHFAPMSMQKTNLPVISSLAQIIGYHDYKISFSDNRIPPVSEDSLYLNIWKPAGESENLPVAVYIHGGSLQTGQPWYADYSGEGFAKEGVIVVNMGYRLGVFGFLADEEMMAEEGTAGNFGLLDQIKALEWVRDNIASFGGDPDNVTLIGESAGAVCVDALCVSPLAEGLFERVILESSTISSPEPPHSYRSLTDALASGEKLKEKYHCSSLDELRKIPADKLAGEMETQHHVTPDGYVFTDDPYVLRKAGIHNEKAILHGFNKEESGPFIIFGHAKMNNYREKIQTFFGSYTDEVLDLYPAENDAEADRYWAEIYGALFFNYSHYCLNRLAAENQIPVYEYLFSKTNKRLSCWHSGELVYAFHVIPETSALYDDSDRKLSDMMKRFWVNFIRTGNPNGEGLPEMEMNDDNTKVMEFGDHTGMIEEPYLKLYDIMDKMYEPAQ